MSKSLENWLCYLEGLHPKTIELGLERVATVANKLNLIPFKPFVITVAGTNGKGSTVALLESIFLNSAYSVASYTSPHLFKFNERIKINGDSVTDAELCAVFEIIEQARNDCPLTYFEFTTLAALYLFANTKGLDLVILEVGLGGRLDAVNIIDSDIAIITNIALDHCEWLGDTREKIGFEKAGIIRSHKPLIFAERNIPLTMIQQAKEKSAHLFYLGKDFDYELTEDTYHWQQTTTKQTLSLPVPQLHPDNVAGVLAAVALMSPHFIFSQVALEKAMTTTVLGRWTKREYPVTQYFDVTHNAHAAAELANKIKKLNHQGKTFAVFSMLQDKDLLTTLKILAPLFDHWFVAPLANPRAFSVEALQTNFNNTKVSAVTYFSSIRSAYDAALNTATSLDVIICFGSFYVVSELMLMIS